MNFQTRMDSLHRLVEDARNREIQLPDFQREYRWDEERVRALLVTVLRGHPMGALLLLDADTQDVRFRPRPLDGASPAADSEPRLLVLDGQQRLTSLMQALSGEGVVRTHDTSGREVQRRYFVHLQTALEGEAAIDEAVIAMPADLVRRRNFNRDIELDLSTTEAQHATGYLPIWYLLEDLGFKWLLSWPGVSDDLKTRLSALLSEVRKYQIPAIRLDRDTSRAAITTVFERVNTGGLELNAFELLTAVFAGDRSYQEREGHDFRLADDWRAIENTFHSFPVLRDVKSTEFLQLVTLLETYRRNRESTKERPPAISARRADILSLSLDDYLRWRDRAVDGYRWVVRFLADHAIFDTKLLPYGSQLVALAAIRDHLGDDADTARVRRRLSQWFWCGVFGELYSGATETRLARDLEEVVPWARGETDVLPRTIQDATFTETRLQSLRTRNSAAYKGIYALLLARGACDWRSGESFDRQSYFDLEVDIHHIFPKAWCRDHGVPDDRRDSIINRTMLAASTNRRIGANAPSRYVEDLANEVGGLERLDELLSNHLIDAAHLRSDDLEGFWTYRREALVGLIEEAMHKSVQRDLPSTGPSW